MKTIQDAQFLPHMWVYTAQTGELFVRIAHYLRHLGYKVQSQLNDKDGKNYVYAPGQIPLMLCGHLDTVHKRVPIQSEIVVKAGKAQAPGVGLGADDRAGIAAIMELLHQGFRPHLLFTDEEESGAAGASFAAETLKAPAIQYIIEMDRRGDKDCVFYDLDNKEFETYVEKFSFKTATGSFTDISILCPAWGIAGVNLSIGYYEAHQASENLVIAEWWATVEKVAKMLQDPPATPFKFVRKKFAGTWKGGRTSGYAGWAAWAEEDEKLLEAAYNPKVLTVSITVQDLTALLDISAALAEAIIATHKDEIEMWIQDFACQLVQEKVDEANDTLLPQGETALKKAEQSAANG